MKYLILVFCLTFIAAGLCFSQSAGSTMYVSVKSAELKNSPSMFASVVSGLNFGDAVIVIENRGKWANVRTANNRSGWTYMAGLRARRVVSSGIITVTEVALAGKGFSGEVEAEYRRGSQGAQGANYNPVDAMEQMRIPEPELLEFINQGRLSRGE